MEIKSEDNIRFFEPYVGKRYKKEGVNGKKVLVLGASFYCVDTWRECHKTCTNTDEKDSREFECTCPVYRKIREKYPEYVLSNEPSTAIEEKYDATSYQNFEIFLQAILLKENPWEYVAFTNYVQFMLPDKETKKKYLTKVDYEALQEVVSLLEPDIIITWGIPVAEHIRKFTGITGELKENEYYLYHPKIGGRVVTMVNLYHPSALSYWCNDLRNSYTYVKMALNGRK